MSHYSEKLKAGAAFPSIEVKALDGSNVTLGKPRKGFDWQMVVVYRGRHCPMCTRYLNQLPEYTTQLNKIGVDLIAVSGDSKEQLENHLESLDINFPITYGLSLKQMNQLGVYISDPRFEQETDHPFAEPGLFVVNENQALHVVDLSNNPFVRPDIQTLANGLAWIRDPKNNYPVRGMHDKE